MIFYWPILSSFQTFVGDMKILTTKATVDHINNMMPHCHGSEETLISCFSPQHVISACYYLLVECTNSTEYIMSSTQTSVITPSNTPLPTDMSSILTIQHTTVITASTTPTEMISTDSSAEDGGVPIAVVVSVIGAMVVIIIGLILLVIVLIVVFSWKNKVYKKSSRYMYIQIVMHLKGLFSA